MSAQAAPNYSNLRWMMIALALILLGAFLWTIRGILLLSLAAIIVVNLISIPVSKLSMLGVKRGPAILITLVGGIFVIYLVMLLVLPTLANQFVTLGTQTIPNGIQQITTFLESGKVEERFPFLGNVDLTEEFQIDANLIREVGERVIEALRQVGGSVLPFVGGVANTVLSVLIVLFLTLFLLAEPDRYKNGFIQLFPLWYRQRAHYILDRMSFLIRRWLYAQMIGMLITGLGTFIGLTLIGIHEAAALAVITAIFSFVPNFGELISVFFALAVGVVQAPDRLLWIVFVIYGVSFIQAQIIGPLIASGTINIPPVLILLGQIVVAGFFGVMGIILAVPIMAIVMVLVQEVYIKDILGDRGGATGATEADGIVVQPPEESMVPDGV